MTRTKSLTLLVAFASLLLISCLDTPNAANEACNCEAKVSSSVLVSSSSAPAPDTIVRDTHFVQLSPSGGDTLEVAPGDVVILRMFDNPSEGYERKEAYFSDDQEEYVPKCLHLKSEREWMEFSKRWQERVYFVEDVPTPDGYLNFEYYVQGIKTENYFVLGITRDQIRWPQPNF